MKKTEKPVIIILVGKYEVQLQMIAMQLADLLGGLVVEAEKFQNIELCCGAVREKYANGTNNVIVVGGNGMVLKKRLGEISRTVLVAVTENPNDCQGVDRTINPIDDSAFNCTREFSRDLHIESQTFH